MQKIKIASSLLSLLHKVEKGAITHRQVFPLSTKWRGVPELVEGGVRWILFGLCFLLLTATAHAVPTISNVEPTSLSDSGFIVTWSTTNESASTEILWGVSDLTNVTTVAGTTKYHYTELTGLHQNTTYQYRVKSGDTLYPPAIMPASTFKTLSKPSGEYLFSFAVMNDLRYAPTKTNSKNARGIPYTSGAQIVTSEVADINRQNVSFTVVNGNIADAPFTYGTEISTDLKGYLEQLDGTRTPSSTKAYKYMPVPGYYDKQAGYGNWITNSFSPLTSQTSIEAIYGYNATSSETDSVFNYQFLYNNYNFIFLDSVKNTLNNHSGSADLNFLYQRLSAEANTKTFIFMAYPAYDFSNINTEKDYPLDIPTSEVDGAFYISNHATFRATIEGFTDTSDNHNPIVAAVISSHLGDNYKRDINGISYVRQGPAVQYPTGYSVYKVYTNGYTKTFYKTTGRDGTDKPYYEIARDQISTEAGIPAEVLTNFWMGSSSMRNFTYTYPFIPGVAPKVLTSSPVSNESGVALNRPLIFTFSEQMLEQDINNWVTISPSAGTITARFLDAGKTILAVSHSTFEVNTNYTATINSAKAKDEGGMSMASDYTLLFNTNGGQVHSIPPTTALTPLTDNTTTNPFPSFVGIASDEVGVTNVEYRMENTITWLSAEAIDGTFNATVEPYRITLTSPLATGTHEIWVRTTDAAGNTSPEGTSVYAFTVAQDKPTMTIKINSNVALSGDPISATPKIEVTITSINALQSARISVGPTQAGLTTVKVDNNYYATYEVTTALSDGIHGITIEAFAASDKAATYEVYPLYVQGAKETSVQGTPLSYPNPFDPGTQTTKISYTLSKASSISLSIHDLSGNLIYKRSYANDAAGSRAGYNEVTWDGRSDTGTYVGNGIYVYLIVADGKVSAKGKLTVLKR